MRTQGFSIMEMLVVAAVLLSVAVPSFTQSLTNSRVQAIAESIQSGLVRARSESINRNAPVRFQLVSDLSSTCAKTSTAGYWLVTQYTSVTNPVNTAEVRRHVSRPTHRLTRRTHPQRPHTPVPRAKPIPSESSADTIVSVTVAGTPIQGLVLLLLW
jgi:type IV fimbrial biogenesis protein FimT